MITLQNKNMTTANSIEPVQVKLSNLIYGFLNYFLPLGEKDNVTTVVFRILKNCKVNKYSALGMAEEIISLFLFIDKE
jgi:hypothetical protein